MTETKTLVLYFSLSGTTQKAAEVLSRATGGQMIQIEPSVKYPSAYSDYIEVAKDEREYHWHPEIATKLPDLAEYDVIDVGFPTWSHQPPMIIHTLFEQFNFQGKTVMPFTTSMSDPIGEVTPEFEKLAKGAGATVLPGFRYNGKDTDVAQFVQTINGGQQ